MRFGFEELGLNRIEARYMVGNDASRRVMEKLGMAFEGISRSEILVDGTYRDVGRCAILREEFKK
jgi:ribosomal-protein-alanine N-acetyltransferase